MKTFIATMVALPIALASSAALADDDTTKSTTDKKQTTTDASKKTDTSKKKSDEQSTTIMGQDIKQKDDDPDVAVGKTQTTAADREPPKRDVVESRAEQLREGEGRNWSAAPLVGYGTNDFGVGLGARAGYTMNNNIYLGGTFLYHFGSEESAVIGNAVAENSTKLLYPGAEVGYDIGVGPVLVRPYGGVGVLFATTKTTLAGTEASNTDNALMLWPGVTAQYIIANTPVFVGGDARLLLPFENVDPSFTILGTAGLKL